MEEIIHLFLLLEKLFYIVLLRFKVFIFPLKLRLLFGIFKFYLCQLIHVEKLTNFDV